MKPTYQDDRMKLYCADSLDMLSKLPKSAALVSDPPYGTNNNCNFRRFTKNGVIRKGSQTFKNIKNDEKPFDPKPWLAFKKVALFGYQFFSESLPIGSVLVWIKKHPKAYGHYMSDAELAWFNSGHGCYVMHHVWKGFQRDSEVGRKAVHPTQKPVPVMADLIKRLKLKPHSIIIDPYMGSGTTGIAAMELGYRFIGIEMEMEFFEIAKSRILLAKQKAESSMGLV